MRFNLCEGAVASVDRLTAGAYRLEQDSLGVHLLNSRTGERAQLLHLVSPPAALDAVKTLSDRERQVFELLGDGQDMHDIAAQMHLSVKTIETYRSRVKQKLDIDKRSQLLRMAMEWNLEQSKDRPESSC